MSLIVLFHLNTLDHSAYSLCGSIQYDVRLQERGINELDSAAIVDIKYY